MWIIQADPFLIMNLKYFRRRVCIAGKNRIAVEGATFVHSKYPDLELCVVVDCTDLGHDTWQPSLAKWATLNSVPVYSLEELYAEEDLCFISLEYSRLLKPEQFKSGDLFNSHFSLLPEYKGMYTSAWPILDGKDYSGVTLHRIDRGIDTGDIIAQTRFGFDSNETARQLYERYLNVGIELFKDWFPKLLSGNFETSPQPTRGSSYRSKSSINYKDLKIDLNQTAASIHNQVRAFTFPEYQLPRVMGSFISGSKILSDKSQIKPGNLIQETNDQLLISTVDHNIRLYKDMFESFMFACEGSNWNDAFSFLKKIPNLGDRNSNGWTPLIVAAYHNQPDMVRWLLDNEANIMVHQLLCTQRMGPSGPVIQNV